MVAVPNRQTIGFDYGIRPTIASVFNPEFLNLWNEAVCVAMAYTFIPQVGLRENVPLAGLAFEKYDKAIELFRLLKSWMEPPCDKSAVKISFIENPEANKYHLHMGPDHLQLLRRTIGEDADKDYCSITFAGFVNKEFPISEYFRQFRNMAEGKEILVCPINAAGKINAPNNTSFVFPLNASEINVEIGFFKEDIRFLNKSQLEPETMEYLSTEKMGRDFSKGKAPSPPPLPTPAEVVQQRDRQLRRFFPVILARLPYNESFTQASKNLQSKYAKWQIDQAACNLYARGNWPELGYGKNVDMMGIYSKLRHSVQDACEETPLHFKFEEKELEIQIRCDVKYLHSSVCLGSTENAASELRTKGYL
jgi:hypothetical protein